MLAKFYVIIWKGGEMGGGGGGRNNPRAFKEAAAV